MSIKESLGERIFHKLNYIFLVLFAFIALYPFIQVLAVSFSSDRAVMSGEVLWRPIEFTFSAYKNIIADGQIFIAMRNTVVLTVVGTILNLVMTTLAAYSLSKKRLGGRNTVLLLITFTMMFSGGMIPSFMLIKNLKLMDTYWALWLPGLMSVYNMFVMKTFFEAIPESLDEAACIDGASDLKVLVAIILPLSLPIIATMALFYAVGWWNSYFAPMLYINTGSKQTLMVKLMQMIDTASMLTVQATEGGKDQYISPETIKAASIFVATVPILCIYPFLQKYFVKSVMIGAIKG